jgi:hypothetical protein
MSRHNPLPISGEFALGLLVRPSKVRPGSAAAVWETIYSASDTCIHSYSLARLGRHAVLGGRFQELSKGSAANSLGFPNLHVP